MTTLMFGLHNFTYIVIAGCLNRRKLSTTKMTKMSLKTQVDIAF